MSVTNLFVADNVSRAHDDTPSDNSRDGGEPLKHHIATKTDGCATQGGVARDCVREEGGEGEGGGVGGGGEVEYYVQWRRRVETRVASQRMYRDTG